jgi:hypothetical protein
MAGNIIRPGKFWDGFAAQEARGGNGEGAEPGDCEGQRKVNGDGMALDEILGFGGSSDRSRHDAPQSYRKFGCVEGARAQVYDLVRGYGSGLCRRLVALLQRGLFTVFGPARLRDHAYFAKAFQQIGETLAVFLAHGSEFQPQSTAGLYVSHHSLSLDLPFLDKKMKIGLRAHGLSHLRVDEQTAWAQIAHLRSIVIPDRAPAHIYVVRNTDA